VNWTLIWSSRALKDAGRLDRTARIRVAGALTRLAETGQGDLKLLQGRDRFWRLRVGEYRVKLHREPETRTIEVLRVLPRGRAYRR
jgi:mRNA-degrading endonuclease RelE of RelBE toxin-antitoxin system